jgi:hypothetical protein
MTSPLDTLKKAVQAVVGAPSLYAAARGAGAGHAAAADVMAASATSLRLAAARSDGTRGRQNAMRHFIWQAYIAGRHGVRVAEAVAAAQEQGRSTAVDSGIDSFNNAVGASYGMEHADQIAEGPMGEVLGRLADVAAAKWDDGELVWVRPR